MLTLVEDVEWGQCFCVNLICSCSVLACCRRPACAPLWCFSYTAAMAPCNVNSKGFHCSSYVICTCIDVISGCRGTIAEVTVWYVVSAQWQQLPTVSHCKCAVSHSVSSSHKSIICRACLCVSFWSPCKLVSRMVVIATCCILTDCAFGLFFVCAVTCLACGSNTEIVETCPVLSLTFPYVSIVYLSISLLSTVCTILVLCTWYTVVTSRLSVCGLSSNNWLLCAMCGNMHNTTIFRADTSAICVCRLVLKCHFSNCWIHKRITWRKCITIVKIYSKTCTSCCVFVITCPFSFLFLSVVLLVKLSLSQQYVKSMVFLYPWLRGHYDVFLFTDAWALKLPWLPPSMPVPKFCSFIWRGLRVAHNE